MIQYLGKLVDIPISATKKKQKSKLGNWTYGYHPDIDTVVISKDGTLGEVYNIMGLNIGLPEKPKDRDIINYDIHPLQQKWDRTDDEMPNELTYESIDLVTSKYTGTRQQKQEQIDSYMKTLFQKHKTYIDRQYEKREKGIWIFIKGVPMYLTGTYWFGIKWFREIEDYPDFRVIQNELMIFWEACKADPRCFGMQYVKNRRMGASLMALFEISNSATNHEDKLLGLISKKGDDAGKIFGRFVKGFKRLPSFFRPVWDGTNNPKKKLNLEEATKRKSVGDSVAMGNGLGTMVEWHNTEGNAMDGDAIFRSLIDEAGKWPKDVPFSKYWEVVKTSHRKGIMIKGKAMVVSTVNALKKGGAEYKKVWDQSDCTDRDLNGRTKSGLYRLFIPTKYCLEGMFDQYGFSIVEDPEKPIMTDQGEMVDYGTLSFLKNSIDALQNDPEGLNEFMRQNPETIKDAFRDESDECEFNLIHIQEQIEHNTYELEDDFKNENDFNGNEDLERGNVRWKDGIKDTIVLWTPDPKGRFFIKKGCHPPEQFRNQNELVSRNGILAKAPIAGHIGTFGVDPYNRSKNADGRGSKGAIILTTKTHTCDELPNKTMIVEYIDRPKKVEIFFEEVIMISVYFSIPFLAELSNERFLAYVKDRGYRHFSMNNPFKKFNQLSPTEIEFGGAPQQDSKIGEGQFYATEAYVQDYVGVARDNNNRQLGQMGDMPFTRTLLQLKDVDTEKRTKYDAYIGFSLSLVGNQKHVKKQTKSKPAVNPFQRFDNSGIISKVA